MVARLANSKASISEDLGAAATELRVVRDLAEPGPVDELERIVAASAGVLIYKTCQ